MKKRSDRLRGRCLNCRKSACTEIAALIDGRNSPPWLISHSDTESGEVHESKGVMPGREVNVNCGYIDDT